MKLPTGGKFEKPQPGNVTAVCVRVIDLGTQPKQDPVTKQFRHSRDVMIGWELGEKMTGIYKPEVTGKPFMVSRSYKQSMHASAGLRAMLQGWRGKKFTDEEAANFDIKSILGKACMLSLIENGEYINVDAVGSLPAGLRAEKQVNPTLYFSLDPDEFDPEVFKTLPDKLREKISKSPEFIKAANPNAAPADSEEPAPFPTDDDVSF